MTASLKAYSGARIFDGLRLHEEAVLVTEDGLIKGLFSRNSAPPTAQITKIENGILCPGYVDLQVNGGGGVMFNAAPEPETLATMAKAHASVGATTILPTLITDTPDHVRRAIDAVEEAINRGVTGIAGLHLEGPHLALARKGAHDGKLIRTMTDEDLALYLDAAKRLPFLKITLAPENATFEQIRVLAENGVLVSLGHTDATFETCSQAVEAGARCVTHLFNAQSQLGNREPGTAGAALRIGDLSAGLIADTVHVHPATIATALAAKTGPGRLFLVSDAMATAGSDIRHFLLNGRRIEKNGNRLTLDDGTLAGAHLDLTTAIRNLVVYCGTPLEQTLAMATAIPAALSRQVKAVGTLRPGARANFLHLSDELQLQQVWQAE